MPPSTSGDTERNDPAAVLLRELGSRQVSLLARVLAAGGSREAAPREVSAGEGAGEPARGGSSRNGRSFLHVGAATRALQNGAHETAGERIVHPTGPEKATAAPNVINIVMSASHGILHQFLQEINKLKWCSYLPRRDFCSSAPD